MLRQSFLVGREPFLNYVVEILVSLEAFREMFLSEHVSSLSKRRWFEAVVAASILSDVFDAGESGIRDIKFAPTFFVPRM